MNSFAHFVIFATIIACAFGASCTNPEVEVTSFSTRDATIVSQVAYIGEFTFKCSNQAKVSLFAELNGKVFPVARVGDSSYQVSNKLF